MKLVNRKFFWIPEIPTFNSMSSVRMGKIKRKRMRKLRKRMGKMKKRMGKKGKGWGGRGRGGERPP